MVTKQDALEMIEELKLEAAALAKSKAHWSNKKVAKAKSKVSEIHSEMQRVAFDIKSMQTIVALYNQIEKGN